MKIKSICKIYELWNELRCFQIAPERMLIAPQLFYETLPDMFLLNGPHDAFRFRLAGSRLTESFGTAMTGQKFESILKPDKKKAALDLLEMVVAAAEPVFCSITLTPSRQPEDRCNRFMKDTFYTGEMVLLPLQHEGRFDLRLLGAARFFDAPHFPIGTVNYLDIVSHRILGARTRVSQGIPIGAQKGQKRILIRNGSLFMPGLEAACV